MKFQSVSEAQNQTLTTALSDLLVLSEAEAVFLSDSGGNLIAHATAETVDDTIYTIAALAAGSFSATRELASLVKEPAFHSIFHQGEQTSIFMQGLGRDYLVLVVFGKGTPVGMIKLYTDRTRKEIEPILKEMDHPQDAAAAKVTFEFANEHEILKKPNL